MGQISFFTFYRIAYHIELGRVGGPPPIALLQSVNVHIFLVRCTIIASSVKYTCCGTPFRNSPLYVLRIFNSYSKENAVRLLYKYQTVDRSFSENHIN